MISNRINKEDILKIVDKVVKEYQPKKVILFGSYAYGEPTEDGDVDFLVVTKRHFNLEETYKMRRELLRDFSITVQLFCVRNEEYLETKDVIGGITYPASKYGKVLYEKP